MLQHIGDKINPKKDIVAVRGKKITKEERMYYIMLNKPQWICYNRIM